MGYICPKLTVKPHGQTSSLRVQIAITAIGVLLFILKIIAWSLTGSVAILTDALESIVNIVAGGLGIYTLYLSAQPKDKNHLYGHGKAEFLSAAVEGTLISVAGLLIIYEAVSNLYHPHEIRRLDTGLVLVGITAIINFIAGQVCVQTGKKNNSLVLISGGNHLKTDTYSTAGIFVGLLLMYWLKISWLDSAVAILFAGIILYTGYRIIRSSVAGIMDETDEELIKKMVDLLNRNRRENWIDFHNMRIIKSGSSLHIDCHLTVPWYLNVHEAHREIDAFSQVVQQEFGESIELFVHSDGCLDISCAICTKQECAVRKSPFLHKLEWDFENVTSDKKHGYTHRKGGSV
jgi:cation diffusion facilitator family transporter